MKREGAIPKELVVVTGGVCGTLKCALWSCGTSVRVTVLIFSRILVFIGSCFSCTVAAHENLLRTGEEGTQQV